MTQAIQPFFDRDTTYGPSIKPKKNTFEEDQVKVFAKIVTILSQDPNNPMEPQKIFEFHNSMTQMVQSKKQTMALEELSKNMQFSQFLQAGNLVGEDVEVKSNQFAVGATQLKYTVPEGALKTFIDILNPDGSVAKTAMGGSKPGENLLSFDHKGQDGKALPLGEYTYRARHFFPPADPSDLPEEQILEAVPVPERGPLPKLSYYMPGGVAKATLEITTETGQIVQVLPGEITEGKHDFTVDGFKDGKAFEPGVYRFQLRALNAKEEAIPVETRVSALVEGIDMKNGVPLLRQSGSIYTPLENYTALNKSSPKKDSTKGE